MKHKMVVDKISLLYELTSYIEYTLVNKLKEDNKWLGTSKYDKGVYRKIIELDIKDGKDRPLYTISYDILITNSYVRLIIVITKLPEKTKKVFKIIYEYSWYADEEDIEITLNILKTVISRYLDIIINKIK